MGVGVGGTWKLGRIERDERRCGVSRNRVVVFFSVLRTLFLSRSEHRKAASQQGKNQRLEEVV
jgi:hypothetical protein